jgi:hypothetical protein
MRVVAFCLVLLSTLAGFAVLVYLEDILIPFTFAFFLACVLEPLQRLVIRTGMRLARACAACVASLRKSGGDRERGTAAEREPLTGTHVQQEPIASELAGLSLRQTSPSASAACGVLALRMAGVVVCVLALVSCLTGFVAVSTFELERLATLADTQDWDRRGEALVNETIRLVNRTHLPPSQIEDYVRSGLAEVPGVVKAVLLGLGNFSVDLLLVCVIVFFMLWSRAAAHVHTAAVIDYDPLSTPRTTEAHRHQQAMRIEPSRLQGSIQVRETAAFLRSPYVCPEPVLANRSFFARKLKTDAVSAGTDPDVLSAQDADVTPARRRGGNLAAGAGRSWLRCGRKATNKPGFLRCHVLFW